jgi:hypothetical protein
MASNEHQILKAIPAEYEVRQRLAQNTREAALLRKLLSVAKAKTELEHSQKKMGVIHG